MRGHIRKRGQRSWAVVVELERDPSTGRRRQQWHSIKGTKRDIHLHVSPSLQEAAAQSFEEGLQGVSSERLAIALPQ